MLLARSCTLQLMNQELQLLLLDKPNNFLDAVIFLFQMTTEHCSFITVRAVWWIKIWRTYWLYLQQTYYICWYILQTGPQIPYFCRRNIYYAFVISHKAYWIEIYANTSKTLLHKLHILYNKLLRILQQQAPLTPIYQLYSTFNSLPIHLLYNQKYWNWYITQCFMFVIYQKCIVTILLLTNRCIVMTLGKAMICIFIISRNQLAKELFNILEVFCGIPYHQFLRNACLKVI